METLKFQMNDDVKKAVMELAKKQSAPEIIAGVEYTRNPDGSLNRITPKPGEAAPINWRERCIKAEKYFLGLIEERKKIQNLILEAMAKIDAEHFKSGIHPLEDFEPYCEIKGFAKGVPHIVRPPLELMPLDGSRTVKRIIKRDTMTEIYLSCAHVIQVPNEDVSKLGLDQLKMNSDFACMPCTQLLKDRGMYETSLEKKG